MGFSAFPPYLPISLLSCCCFSVLLRGFPHVQPLSVVGSGVFSSLFKLVTLLTLFLYLLNPSEISLWNL